MRVPVAAYSSDFGISWEHWHEFVEAADRLKLVILVRKGKASAIPWIEMGFPAKPLSLKTKVDPATGLLIAPRSGQASVFAAGHWVLIGPGPDFRVLQSAGQANPPSISSVAPYLDHCTKCRWQSWARENLVIDARSGLPFTSDYDLAAVIDTRDARRGKSILADVSAGKTNWTNPWVETVARELNQLMRDSGTCVKGQDRILHGPQTFANADRSPMNKQNELILAFAPKRLVYHLVCATHEQGWKELERLLDDYLPKTPQFAPGKILRPDFGRR